MIEKGVFSYFVLFVEFDLLNNCLLEIFSFNNVIVLWLLDLSFNYI